MKKIFILFLWLMPAVICQAQLRSSGTGTGNPVYSNSPNITTPTGITKSDVGLGNVSNNAQLTIANNLSDLNNAGTARTNLGGTTVGINLFTATNPSAVRFVRINADNTITLRSSAELLSDIGAQASGTYLVAANNLSDVTASTARTNLGATTVGANLFTVTNPSAVRFVRVNADNTVTLRSSSELLSDIGGQASGSYAASGANTDITSVLLNQTGLVVKGASSNALTIKPNETLSAGRILNIITGDASRSLTFTGDASISGTNTGDQTTVSGNAGTATALQTPRAIYGNNFDGTGDLTQIIASTYGGTGNGFTKFTGPATSEKTFTLPNASATILYDGGALGTPSSGTLTNCTFPTLNQSTTGSAATLTTSRNLWGQGFNGSADVTGSLTSVGDISGGASNMTITSGTGASRTLTFKTTTSGSTATTVLDLAADQSATFANTVNIPTLKIPATTGLFLQGVASPTGTEIFNTSNTITNPSAIVRPVMSSFLATAAPAASGGATDYHAIDVVMNGSSANINNLTGFYAVEGDAYPSAADVLKAVGVYGIGQWSGTGTMGDMYGLQSFVRNLGTGTVSTGIGLSIRTGTNVGGGVISNLYGLKIENQTAGGNNWALRTGTGLVEFGDVVKLSSSGFNIAGAATTGKFIVGDGTKFAASTSTIPTSAGATANKVLLSDGTNYVLSTPTFPNASASSGKFIRSDGTNWVASTPTLPTSAGTSGKVLLSDGTNYIESTPTFPNASASSGKFIRSDGTNWVASTPTLPTSAGTSGKVLLSDGTNYIESTPTFPNASATSGKMIKSDGTNWTASTETYAAPGTSGNTMKSDGTNWTSVDDREDWSSFVVSGSDATTTGQSLVDITGLVSGTLTNSTLYEVEAWLYVSTSAVTTGTQYGIQTGGSGGVGVVEALIFGTTTTNAVTQATLSAPTAAQGTFLTTSSAAGVIHIHGFVTTRGSGTATISIQHLKVTSGTSTVKIGSKMLIRLAN